MPNYREIYNQVVSTDARYNLAENSPGLRAVTQATDRLSMLSGRALDVGCGVGFAIEYLSGRAFDLNVFGVDISDAAIEQAKVRLAKFAGSQSRLHVLQNQSLPFEDEFFSLVTCFDVLEHLDEADIEASLAEIRRVVKPGGVLLVSVSCRTSGVEDLNGENLHRTVRSPDWWIEKFAPDSAEYDGHRVQLTLWKHIPLIEQRPAAVGDHAVQGKVTSEEAKIPVVVGASDSIPPTAHEDAAGSSSADQVEDHNTAELYQKIYDENPWYGDAEQGRCPGVRLLPHYREWLIEPVMDLGCGRGQTVEHLRSLGMQADGIDQIKKHPGMRVGDITQPISGLEEFNSVVCVDCIEHLYEPQVLGLFANMRQVKRQAFSIHNGPSTGTGQELHVNRKSFSEWSKLIAEHFEIADEIQISPEQMLYLTMNKS